MGGEPAREVFQPSGSRVAFEGFATGCGAVAFLVRAGLFLLGIVASPIEVRRLGVGMFGFGGLLLATGAVADGQGVPYRHTRSGPDRGRRGGPGARDGQGPADRGGGGIAQGLGFALMEAYVPGRTENLHDYLIPTVGDMPEIECLLIEDAEPSGPYGAKGVGEPALVPTAPAILGAIHDAVTSRPLARRPSGSGGRYRQPTREAIVEPTGTGMQPITFERSAGQQVLGTGCAAIGGSAFLGMAVLSLLGILGPDLLFRLIGGAGFGFFGLLMVAGALSGARRGTDPRVAEISSAGAWLPEMGKLGWPEIAEIRLERIRGVGDSDAPVTRQFRRLGFVPRDPSLRPDGAAALAARMTRLYTSFLNAIAPEVRFGGDEPAPFGISENELPKDFDRLVEVVGRFATIVDAAEARARLRARRWGTDRPDPASPVDLGALDAALALDREARPVAAGVPLVEASTDEFRPSRAFVVPAVKPLEVILAVLPVAAPVAIVVPVLLPTVLAGELGGTVALVVLAFIGAAFVIPGVVAMIQLLRRMGERRADAARLRVGPDGIWTRDGGLVEWDAVGAIRTERAGWVRRPGSPPFERWRLVVEASRAGAPAGSALSDALDARFDDVLDLIRFYHPVVETS